MADFCVMASSAGVYVISSARPSSPTRWGQPILVGVCTCAYPA